MIAGFSLCIAGPSGLQVALSLARQGVSFRIIGEYSFPTALDGYFFSISHIFPVA
jgi:2-polyprenyl-6-methoxyphenol hydroxylase-like FAD-dependent oxidoreductase